MRRGAKAMAETGRTIHVSSITNAMRGKTLLAQQGIRGYIQRNTDSSISNGCGYSLQVPYDAGRAEQLLREAGIRITGVSVGSDHQ